MKNKCPLCQTGKARRTCPLKNEMMICSSCCAEIRDPTCGECPHYEEALRYALQRETRLQTKHFITELDPEVQEEVDHALGMAEQGKIKKSFKAMERLAEKNPGNHNACYGMGTLWALKGNDAEAIPWFEKAISIFPYMAEAHYNLGISYQRTYDINRMIKSLRKAVQYSDPKDPPYQSAHAILENLKQGLRETEGVDLDSYIISSEKFEIAFKHMEKKQWSTAIKGFKAALIHNEKNAPTHGNLGICLAQLGRKSEALVAMDRALEIDPDYELANVNRPNIERLTEGTPPEDAELRSINYSVEQLKIERKANSES